MKTLELRPLFVVFITLGLITGVVYPLAITGIGQSLFPYPAQGSLLKDKTGAVQGSTLLAQKFMDPRYFQPRPSAGDFATVSSGASNLSPVSQALSDAKQARALAWTQRGGSTPVPEALLTTSGSGLDPHLPPEALYYQAPLVAKARGIDVAVVNALIAAQTEQPTLGFMGQVRVDVLLINQALDNAK